MRDNWLLRLLQCQVQGLPVCFEDCGSVNAASLTGCVEEMKHKITDVG